MIKNIMSDKTEIISTRMGGFGSSDSKMIAQIGKTGILSETAKKRIALMLGLIEKKEFSTKAIEMGNHIEDCIFEAIKKNIPIAISNPYYKSEILSENYGFDVFNHIDIEVETANRIIWYEIKATIHDAGKTMEDYKYQLAWHYMLLEEKAKASGKDAILTLVHYFTANGMEYNAENITRVTVSELDISSYITEIKIGLLKIASLLPDFTYTAPEQGEDNLPIETQSILPTLKHLFALQQEYNDKVAELKEKLKEGMKQSGITAIDNEVFKAVLKSETTRQTIDVKELKKAHPEIYSKFLKTTKVDSSLCLTIK